MANLYYVAPSVTLVAGSVAEVTGDEAHHAVRVSRLRAGERILLGTGSGVLASGAVVAVERNRFTVACDEVTVEEAPRTRLVLVQALAKGDRDERAVEQATEFGVDVIIPWEAERSVSRWQQAGSEKAARGVAKWARIAREASKQSLRSRIPEVSAPATTPELCAAATRAGVRTLVLHPRSDHRLSDWAAAAQSSAQESPSEVRIMIGPEGGFSDAELTQLTAAGAEVVRLGTTVLRTSSAGPAALAVLSVGLGRW